MFAGTEGWGAGLGPRPARWPLRPVRPAISRESERQDAFLESACGGSLLCDGGDPDGLACQEPCDLRLAVSLVEETTDHGHHLRSAILRQTRGPDAPSRPRARGRRGPAGRRGHVHHLLLRAADLVPDCVPSSAGDELRGGHLLRPMHGLPPGDIPARYELGLSDRPGTVHDVPDRLFEPVLPDDLLLLRGRVGRSGVHLCNRLFELRAER